MEAMSQHCFLITNIATTHIRGDTISGNRRKPRSESPYFIPPKFHRDPFMFIM